jgi:hypothetical protein
MPIPSREKGEDKDKFVSRCISEIIDEYGQEQASAICYTKSEEKMSVSVSNETEEVFVLKPKKTENRGRYLQRCSAHPKMKEQFKDMKDRMGQCLNAFNSYYKYWSRLESFGEEDTKGTVLGDCIAKKKAQGLDYKSAYARCASRVVVPSGPIVLSEDDNLLIEPVEFNEMNVLGYMTKYFYICPGAQSTFEHLISMNPDEETSGMIRSAAQIADNVFEIEAKVMKDEMATPSQLEQAELLVDDFYDLMQEIDEELGMLHDVSYMDGHIQKISSFLK